jgi:hypothetical protein
MIICQFGLLFLMEKNFANPNLHNHRNTVLYNSSTVITVIVKMGHVSHDPLSKEYDS